MDSISHQRSFRLKQLARTYGFMPLEWRVLGTQCFCESEPDVFSDCVSATSSEVGFGRRLTKQEAADAAESCFRRGWLQVATHEWIEDIGRELEARNVLGPVLGMPLPGTVQFTKSGAEFFREIYRQVYGDLSEQAESCGNIVSQTWRHYFLAIEKAQAFRELQLQDGLSVGSINAIGRWRWRWWEAYPNGYWLDVRRISFDRQRGRPFDDTASNRPQDRSRRSQLRHDLPGFLAKCGLSQYEWALLATVFSGSRPSVQLLRKLQSLHKRRYGDTGAEKIQSALESCIRRKLLVYMDAETKDQIRRELATDPALGPVVCPFTASDNEIELTPGGAAVYRSVLGDMFSEEFDAASCIESCWRFFFVGESRAYDDRQMFIDDACGSSVASEIAKVGQWSPRWWQVFADGYCFDGTTRYPSVP